MEQYTLNIFRQMLSDDELQDESARRLRGIIDSMTFLEQTRPAIIDRERTDRIARGSGTNPGDVTELLRQFAALKSVMEKMDKNW